ncbi:hypothetical protein MMC16_000278 [Acarospora aff. strigata]|nr:hypothetical protein [Acarospora aff. strigata]
MGNETPAFILALLTGAGGITGYIRTGSVPSVAAGVTVGALVRLLPSPPPCSPSFALTNLKTKYALGGLRMQKRQPYGVELALLASVILAGSSVPRAIRTQKPLPAGLSAVALYGLWQFGNAWRNQL